MDPGRCDVLVPPSRVFYVAFAATDDDGDGLIRLEKRPASELSQTINLPFCVGLDAAYMLMGTLAELSTCRDSRYRVVSFNLIVTATGKTDKLRYRIAPTRNTLLVAFPDTPRAYYELGTKHSTGRNAVKDLAAAAMWYQKAAQQGHIRSQVELARLYEQGAGIPKDDDLAMAWYLKAAEQGNVFAQTAVGYLQPKPEPGRRLVTAEARRDADAFARFGTGLEALRTSGQWEEQAATRYRGLTDRPAVQSLFKALADRRAPLLQAAEPTLSARIQAARSSADLAEVRDTYMSVASDMGHPAGARLYQLALKQDAQLRSAELAKTAQDAEKRREEASPCAKMSNTRGLGEEGDEPTARDMCLAYERLIAGTQEGLKDMQNDCRSLSGNASNPLLAINCLMSMAGGIGGGPQLSLSGFEKIACFKAGGGPSFLCDFAAGLSSANPIFGPTVNRASGEVITGYFTPRGSTWIYRRP